MNVGLLRKSRFCGFYEANSKTTSTIFTVSAYAIFVWENNKNWIFSKGQHSYILKLIISVSIRPVLVVSVENWLGEFCFFNLQLQTGVLASAAEDGVSESNHKNCNLCCPARCWQNLDLSRDGKSCWKCQCLQNHTCRNMPKLFWWRRKSYKKDFWSSEEGTTIYDSDWWDWFCRPVS